MGGKDPFADFDGTMDARLREANEFYDSITPAKLSEDEQRVMRQALAGMLWSKQYYFFDPRQMAGGAVCASAARRHARATGEEQGLVPHGQ
jgi:hypothetical protein